MARTLTATIVPSPWNTCVTPTLRPMSPILMSSNLGRMASAELRLRARAADAGSSYRSSHLDFDVDARGKRESHQGVDGLRARIQDVDEPLVRSDLELLPAVLVDERRTQDGELLDPGRQRHRTDHVGSGSLGRLDDL